MIIKFDNVNRVNVIKLTKMLELLWKDCCRIELTEIKKVALELNLKIPQLFGIDIGFQKYYSLIFYNVSVDTALIEIYF